MSFLSFGLGLYSCYTYLSYKYLRQSQVDDISTDYCNKYGLNWMENDSLVMKYASDISRWSIGSQFSNSKLYSFILLVFICILVGVIVSFGFLSFLGIIVLVFLSNLLIGLIFKGVGLQYSVLISLLLGLIVMIL